MLGDKKTKFYFAADPLAREKNLNYHKIIWSLDNLIEENVFFLILSKFHFIFPQSLKPPTCNDIIMRESAAVTQVFLHA